MEAGYGTIGYSTDEYSPEIDEYNIETADYNPGPGEYEQLGDLEYSAEPLADTPWTGEYSAGTVEYGEPVADYPQPEASLDVPLLPGDFIPPPPDSSSPVMPVSGELSNLPPEILAALASIPPGSADSFDLPAVTEVAPPATESATPAPLSWVRLSIDPESRSRFYAVWQVDGRDRPTTATGETLAVRLYDVTGLSTQAPLPAPVEEQRCHDDFAQDWYLPIPQWERIYIAEIGYISTPGQWRTVARSTEVAAIDEKRGEADG